MIGISVVGIKLEVWMRVHRVGLGVWRKCDWVLMGSVI